MREAQKISGETDLLCAHCGEICRHNSVSFETHRFCCEGCKLVYCLLTKHHLENYYTAAETFKVGRKPSIKRDYSFLENEEILNELLEYSSDERQSFTFQLPDIHCSSCIWLLEHLDRLTPGIYTTRVNFLKKSCSITYDPRVTTLSNIAELLHKIGYTPRFNQDQLGGSPNRLNDRTIYYKIGVAGFCFGNIMLLSFPDYLGLTEDSDFALLGVFNLILSLPVLLYSGIDYLKNAWRPLRIRHLGIDVPIALGIVVLFGRSAYEILTHSGVGYLDSLSGFIFFLLIGKWFQQYSQQSISFDRDYRSFFPISVLQKSNLNWINTNVQDVKRGAIVKIRNGEIIPCDSILLSPTARMDYSFVTGEEKTQSVEKGSKLYAGGRLKGQSIEIQIKKPVDQSYLTRLWNNKESNILDRPNMSLLVEKVGHYFVLGILFIALVTLIYWMQTDISKAFNAVTAVLIIACPCVLALSVPFIYGNILRLLAKDEVYCRNTDILEKVHSINTVVFDKTGTLTDTSALRCAFEGKPLSPNQRSLIKSLAMQSAHPLSQAISHYFNNDEAGTLTHYKEHVGKGLEGVINGQKIRIGAPGFIFHTDYSSDETSVLLEIDGHFIGQFLFQQALRKNTASLLRKLSSSHSLVLLTGDGKHDEARMSAIFPPSSLLLFNQRPFDKLDFIKAEQEKGNMIMMVGDGLNDAGALSQSDIGIVVSQSSNNFTPACDIIVSRSAFEKLATILDFIVKGRLLLYGAFCWAFLYNMVGLYFAVTAQLSPVIAAILMPVSSLTIVIYALVSTHLLHYHMIRRIQC